MTTSTATSPIGTLMIEAERKAKMKKTHVHTSEAACGCMVTISWISNGCHLITPDRCADHAFARGSKR